MSVLPASTLYGPWLRQSYQRGQRRVTSIGFSHECRVPDERAALTRQQLLTFSFCSGSVLMMTAVL